MNHKGVSILEYFVLITIIVGALIIFKNYTQRAIFGAWKQTGSSYAFGRQYDFPKTIECGYDDIMNVWYDATCFQNRKTVCEKANGVGNIVCHDDPLNAVVQDNCVKDTICDESNH